jgi:hypothetical protein
MAKRIDPIAREYEDPITDDHLRAIGRIIVRWSRLNGSLWIRYGKWLPATHSALPTVQKWVSLLLWLRV